MALSTCVALLCLAPFCEARAQDAPSTGQLLIVTEPAGARVFVDGRAVGVAPISVPDLLPGPHIVVAVGEDGARVEQIAEVTAGRSELARLTVGVAPAVAEETVPEPAAEV